MYDLLNCSVFQYTFKIPGEEKTWTVMWDYNIGLVRTTHLFKCNDYSKVRTVRQKGYGSVRRANVFAQTTPAKMLNANPGLRDICHSITGGALAAQGVYPLGWIVHMCTDGSKGYWMPFEAAKAVAATFCWKIRYALTPLFGTDFPSMCIPPQGAQFGKMIIDPAIVRRAAESANYYRMLELQSKLTPSSSATSTTSLIGRPPLPRAMAGSTTHNPPRRKISSSGQKGRLGPGKRRIDDTDSEGDDSYHISPPSPASNSFTPINCARSPSGKTMTGGRTTIRHHTNMPSPREILASISGRGTKITPAVAESEEDGEDSSDSELSSISTSFSKSSTGMARDPTERAFNAEPSSEAEGDDGYDDEDEEGEYMADDASTTSTSTRTPSYPHPSSSSSSSSSAISPSLSPISPSLSSDSDSERTTTLPKRARIRTRTRTRTQRRRTPTQAKPTRASTSTSTSTDQLISREVKAAHALLSLHTYHHQQQLPTTINGINSRENIFSGGNRDDDHHHHHHHATGRKRRRRAASA
jgi:hypothetical protein